MKINGTQCSSAIDKIYLCQKESEQPQPCATAEKVPQRDQQVTDVNIAQENQQDEHVYACKIQNTAHAKTPDTERNHFGENDAIARSGQLLDKFLGADEHLFDTFDMKIMEENDACFI